MEEQKLQEWFNENTPDENLIFRQGLNDQVFFVRDILRNALCSSYEEYEQTELMVVSTHRSKSVLLPVYQVRHPSDLILTMRYNFHDWKISVDAPRPVDINPASLFSPNETISQCYLEGFPDDLGYGSYEDDPSCFTAEVSDKYHLYVLVFLIRRALQATAETEEE